jgi:RNA methyltransferase, TrmH family
MSASYVGGRPVESADAARGAMAVDRVRATRSDPRLVLLEGVHALKHAVRFGADIELVLSPDATELGRLLGELAPDVVLPVTVLEVPATVWRAATGRDLPSPALAVARRPDAPAPSDVPAPSDAPGPSDYPGPSDAPGPSDVPDASAAPMSATAAGAAELMLDAGTGRVVVLEQPRHLGNLGAVVRVAAAAGAAGVLVVGDADPWHPTAVRAAAGLQFALPVARSATLPETGRPVVAVAPDEPIVDGAGTGDRGPGVRRLPPGRVPADAVLLFGTERGGLSPDLRGRAEATVGIPMRAGVSSLNLATAVAVLLYAGRDDLDAPVP